MAHRSPSRGITRKEFCLQFGLIPPPEVCTASIEKVTDEGEIIVKLFYRFID